ncbi:TIGR01244 family sulfur transferase [Castellaniella sp.]|uniref:TIGR01244 family sulfur transferase n=1 Tax=Castellaniella sp. TaxID=1955812 RepID=UPI00356A03C5
MNPEYHRITPEFSVAPQLGPDDMPALARAGFKSVIINRPDGEGGAAQPRSDDVIAAAVAAGLKVHYQPVDGRAITPENVAEFARLLQELPGPVLAYCRSGARCTKLYERAHRGG